MKYSISLSAVAALSTLAGSVAAKTKMVSVGEGGLKFTPDTFKADKGDIIMFEFYPMNHSVVQGTADKPCTPVQNGFYSGYIPSKEDEADQMFQITVNTTDPIYIYCSQGEHCNDGMVGIINPGSVTIDTLKTTAKGAGKASAPAAMSGGMIVTDTNSSSSDSSSSMMSGSMTMTATGTMASASGSAASAAAGASSSGLAAGRVEGAAGAGFGLVGLVVAAAGYLI